MPLQNDITVEELLALAAERAAMEVETWIPEKIGDRIAGIVLELGTISTKYGDYYTTTMRVTGNYIEDGKEKFGQYIRVAWMGAVLKAQFTRMQPRPDDICAFHYQKDITPQSQMNDYPLIVAAVLDSRTGKAKIPVNLGVYVPTADDIANADPRTGEISPVSQEERLTLRPGEEPFVPEDASQIPALGNADSAGAKKAKA